jgi:hypothetical protein
VAARPGEDGWRLGVLPTGGSHLSARGRERGEEAGRWWAEWAESGDGPWGREVGWVYFFFSLFFSKPFSNLFQTLFKFKTFSSFQIQILTQISPTILKDFHKPFLTTFQTYFKFKPLHKFSQTISQLFF